MVIIPRDSFEWSPMTGGLATDLVSVWNGPFWGSHFAGADDCSWLEPDISGDLALLKASKIRSAYLLEARRNLGLTQQFIGHLRLVSGFSNQTLGRFWMAD